MIKYSEGTKQPESIMCRNIVVSYAEVWQFLQNKARQYGPEEKKMVLSAPQPNAAPAALAKIESISPGSGMFVVIKLPHFL